MTLDIIETPTGYTCSYKPNCFADAIIKDVNGEKVVAFMFQEPDPACPSRTQQLPGIEQRLGNIPMDKAREKAKIGLAEQAGYLIG